MTKSVPSPFNNELIEINQKLTFCNIFTCRYVHHVENNGTDVGDRHNMWYATFFTKYAE